MRDQASMLKRKFKDISKATLTDKIKSYKCSQADIACYINNGLQIINSNKPNEDTLWNALTYDHSAATIQLLLQNGAKVNNSNDLTKNSLWLSVRYNCVTQTTISILKAGGDPSLLPDDYPYKAEMQRRINVFAKENNHANAVAIADKATELNSLRLLSAPNNLLARTPIDMLNYISTFSGHAADALTDNQKLYSAFCGSSKVTTNEPEEIAGADSAASAGNASAGNASAGNADAKIANSRIVISPSSKIKFLERIDQIGNNTPLTQSRI
jgi:hypothetical protein